MFESHELNVEIKKLTNQSAKLKASKKAFEKPFYNIKFLGEDLNKSEE